MKKYAFYLFMLFSFSSCKKAIQNIQEDLVLKAMTNGQWHITKFINNGATITTDFAAYKFQYYENKTVDAIKNGVIEQQGNWDGNANTMTTSAHFPSAVYPLDLINGNWLITNNSWTFVEATQTVGADVKKMRLEKL